MAKTLEEVRDEAMTLGVEERGELADAIWESLLTDEEREIQEAWLVEAQRRLSELESGKVKGVPLEDVVARLRAQSVVDRHSSHRAKTLDDVRVDVMQLADEDRQKLVEEIFRARWNPAWREAWSNESEQRYDRLKSGKDRGLSLDEFWTDNTTL